MIPGGMRWGEPRPFPPVRLCWQSAELSVSSGCTAEQADLFRKTLLRCLDENTPTERSPFSRPANKHFRAAAADAAAAPPDAPLLPQLSPFTKVAAI